MVTQVPAMEEAIEALVSGLTVARSWVSEVPEWGDYEVYLSNVDLRALADNLRSLWRDAEKEDCGQGWPSSKEADLRQVLSRAFPPVEGQSTSGLGNVARILTQTGTGAWRNVFLIHSLVSTSGVEGEEAAIELYRSWGVRFNYYERASQFLYALRTVAVAESHQQNGHGWHFHLVRAGDRLGYRLFFDARKTQQDLAWEKHGTGHVSAAGGSLPYGDPRVRVLDPGASRSIHHECLVAARAQSTLGQHQRFAVWAAKFVQASSKSYIAHPPVQGGAPVRWETS